MEYLDTQGPSHLLSSVSYSDLRYDPNWRSNLKTNGFSTDTPKICIEEYQPEEEYTQSCGEVQGLEINGKYRCIIDMGSVVVETPHMAFSQPDQLYHLHPPDAQSSAASLGCRSNNLQHTSQSDELPSSSNFSVANKSDKRSQRLSLERCKNGFVNANMSHQRTDDVNSLEFQTCCQQEPRDTQQGPHQKQKLSKSTLMSNKGVWNKNLGRKTMDIVERNKITLGHNASRRGSYVRVHALKQERHHHVNEVYAFSTKAVSTENRDDSSDLTLMLEHGQDSAIQMTSLLGRLHWSHIQLTLPAGIKRTGSEALNEQLIQQKPMGSPGQRMLPLSSDGEAQNLGQDKVHIKQAPQSFPRTHAPSQTLDSYAVLPPIGKSATKIEHEPSPGPCVNTARPIHKSSSDSYLSQLEKQKKLRDNVTYKTHTPRDYKQPQADTNLRGPGSDHTVTEQTETKEAKLYSNVICARKKEKSGIPFLPAKDVEDDDKKVPRTKALEYAKTIAKPRLQAQPKQRQKQPVFAECAPHLQGLDSRQLATLELLRKRHEREKQVVAHFRKNENLM